MANTPTRPVRSSRLEEDDAVIVGHHWTQEHHLQSQQPLHHRCHDDHHHHHQQQQQHRPTSRDTTTITTLCPRGLGTNSAPCNNLSATDCYQTTAIVVTTDVDCNPQQCRPTRHLALLDYNKQLYSTAERSEHEILTSHHISADVAAADDDAVSQIVSAVGKLQVATTTYNHHHHHQQQQQQQQQKAAFDPYLQDDDGDSLLHLAIIVEDRDEQLINTIISAAASVDELNLQNHDYQTALHLAVITDQPNTVKRLLQCAVDVSCQERCHGDTALHLACRLNKLDCFNVLLHHTTTSQLQQLVHIYNYEGETCLHVAAEQPDKQLFYQLLAQCSLDVNVIELRHGRTVLHAAVDRNDLQVVQMLLEHPFLQINESTTYDGLTALNFAQSRCLVEMETLLVKAGALATQIPSDIDE